MTELSVIGMIGLNVRPLAEVGIKQEQGDVILQHLNLVETIVKVTLPVVNDATWKNALRCAQHNTKLGLHFRTS